MPTLFFVIFTPLFLILLPLVGVASLSKNWPKCVDQAEFSYQSGPFSKHQAKIDKKGCKIKFVAFGVAGEKMEINVCRSPMQITLFPSIDSDKSSAVYAFSGNCEKPLFGADISSGHKEDALKFEKLRKKIWLHFASIEQEFGIVDQNNVGVVENFLTAGSDVKLACAKQLLDAYLTECKVLEGDALSPMSSESPKPSFDKNNLPPGVHPENIKFPR